MRPEDILERLRARPFQPFRLYLSDGAIYEIRHAEWHAETRVVRLATWGWADCDVLAASG
jgi:hypothetical protein